MQRNKFEDSSEGENLRCGSIRNGPLRRVTGLDL
jgi:hypothetical protein